MDLVTDCLPEIRYFLSLSKLKSQKYIKEASPKFIECLRQIAINIVYGGKHTNGLDISPAHVKPLKKHKSTLLQLTKTKKPSAHRRLLKKGGVAVALLAVLGSVIGTLAGLL